MQYVNDDMDELFRRAAEHYPLDTNSADWSKVAAALQNVGTSTLSAERKRNTNSRLLWLLLLLPLGLICNQLYTPGVEVNKTGRTVGGGKKDVADNNQITKVDQVTVDQTKPIENQSSDVDKTASDNQISTIASDEKTSTNNSNNVTQNLTFASNQKSSVARNKDELVRKSSDYNYPASQQIQTENISVAQNESSDEVNVPFRKYIFQITRDKADKNAIAINRPLTPVENPNKNLKKPYVKGSKGFYFGLMGGIDFTTVEFQKFDEKGFTHGIVAGYQINNNWSIETGIFKENKYYYSDGKYFNTSKIYMPPNSKITEVTGECNMYEVPVNVKYNFSSGKQGWFVSAGSSSYIMKKEDYNYTYYYGTSGPYPRYKQYLNSSKNLFATANISGGYFHSLGNFADLRIEPYVKVPLAGLGIGKLPLLSTGINIGITKKF